ncbi:MAG: serine/threonine-protein kinase [Verrucomicrobiota bacterium]
MIRLIGSGSSGQVWLARNALGFYRAVKIVQANRFKHFRHFEREFDGILKFEPVSRLHDGLVDILQVGRNEDDGYFYCVMELADDVVAGPNIYPPTYSPRTLEQDKARLGRHPVAECVRLGTAIASALGFLHRHGLFHRDIKPSNIIFVSGAPKLADIGLVTDAPQSRSFVGTEGFLAPEGSGTVCADIYALGKVLYEISTGKDRNEYPALPEIPASRAETRDFLLLNRIVLKACRAKAWQRYQTAEEMMRTLLAFEFDKADLRNREYVGLVTKVFAVIGAMAALGVFGVTIWRIIWLSLLHK